MRVTIYWATQDKEVISKIRTRFKIPKYTSLNGETPCEVDEKDLELLKETEKRGFLQIRNK